MFWKSENGEGRTLWQILWGLNKKNPVAEFNHWNPLNYTNGKTYVEVEQSPLNSMKGKRYLVYQSNHGKFIFDQIKDLSIRYALYEMKDVDKERYAIYVEETDEWYDTFVLKLFDEFPYDKDFEQLFLNDPVFKVIEGKDGIPIENPIEYVSQEGAIPSNCVTIKNGTERKNKFMIKEYYHEDAELEEYVFVFMDTDTGMFKVYMGFIISPGDIFSVEKV